MGKGSSETQTSSLSREDANAIRMGRRAAEQTATAALGGQTAGVNQLTQEQIQMLQNLYGQYGGLGSQLLGGGFGGLGAAQQTGLGGLGAYANPMIEQQLRGLDPMYAQQLDTARMQANDLATKSGAFGGSRHGVLQAELQGNVLRNQAAQYGDIYGQSTRDAMQAMLGERGRLGQLGLSQLGMGFGALGQQGALAGQLGGIGDYLRQIQQQGFDQNYLNRVRAQQAIQQGYGKDIKSYVTTEKEGNLFNDLLGLGMMGASLFVPGSQPALGALGGLGGFGGGGGPTLSSWMGGGPQPTIWNYGGFTPQLPGVGG